MGWRGVLVGAVCGVAATLCVDLLADRDEPSTSNSPTDTTTPGHEWSEPRKDQLASLLNPEHTPPEQREKPSSQPREEDSESRTPRQPEYPRDPQDLVLRVSAPQTLTAPSETASLRIEVVNTQAHSARVPPVTLKPPAGVSLRRDLPENCEASTAVICTHTVLAGHSSVKWSIPLTVSSSEFMHTMRVLHGGSVMLGDALHAQNYTLTLSPRRATELQVSAVLNPRSPAPGETTRLGVTLKNLLPTAQQESVRITLRLPSSFRPTDLPRNCTSQATALVCDVELSPDASHTSMSFPIKVDATATPGAELTPVTVSVVSLTDLHLGNNTQSIPITLSHPQANLELRTHTEEVLEPGQVLPFDTQIHNNGAGSVVGPVSVTLRLQGPAVLAHTQQRTPTTPGLPLGCEALTPRSVTCTVKQPLSSAAALRSAERVLAAHTRVTSGEGAEVTHGWNIHNIPVMVEVLPTAGHDEKVLAESVMRYGDQQYRASVDAVVLAAAPRSPPSENTDASHDESVAGSTHRTHDSRTLSDAGEQDGEVGFTLSSPTRRMYLIGVISAVIIAVIAMTSLGGIRRSAAPIMRARRRLEAHAHAHAEEDLHRRSDTRGWDGA